MAIIPKLDAEQLSLKARKVLLTMLRAGSFTQAGKLPPEEVLAQNLGVSRTVVRDVLANLESEGFITRRRGIGTVINKQVVDIATRLDLESEFLEMVADAGYTPRIAFVNVLPSCAKEDAAKRLRLEVGEDILIVERLVLADERPAIFCIDYLPRRIIVEPDYEQEELQAPIFDFMESRCHTRVDKDLTEIEPCLADARLAGIFGISEGSPLLHLDEIGYNIEQEPVLWSQEYYPKGIFHFTVLRRKI